MLQTGMVCNDHQVAVVSCFVCERVNAVSIAITQLLLVGYEKILQGRTEEALFGFNTHHTEKQVTVHVTDGISATPTA